MISTSRRMGWCCWGVGNTILPSPICRISLGTRALSNIIGVFRVYRSAPTALLADRSRLAGELPGGERIPLAYINFIREANRAAGEGMLLGSDFPGAAATTVLPERDRITLVLNIPDTSRWCRIARINSICPLLPELVWAPTRSSRTSAQAEWG